MDNTYYFDFSELQLINKIGDGPFAQVFRAKDMKTGLIFSAQILSRPLEEPKDKTKSNKNIQHEIKSTSKLNHPLIVNFVGFHFTDFKGNNKPVIITEYMTKFSLSELIQSSNDDDFEIKLDDTRRLIIIFSIASAMSFLHSQKIVHCHLKPNNIIFDEQYYPKITDFFLSKYTHQNPRELLNAASNDKTAILYLSPEAFSASHFTKAGDVYSFAMIVYQIMSSK